MNILRRLGLSLVVILFSLCTSLFVAVVSLYAVFDSPQTLKGALSTSGIYDTLIKDVIDKQKSTMTLQAVDPGVQEALEKSFSPAFLQQTAEKMIDDTYAWVKGESQTLHLSIDTAPLKDSFADNLASYIYHKLGALPPCPLGYVPPSTTEGILALTCLPAGVSPQSIADTAREEALRNNPFAEIPTIDPNTAAGVNNPSLTDQFAFIPALREYYLFSLFLLPCLLIIFAVAIIYWSKSKRAGLKRIAWLFISSGATYVILAAISIWLLRTGAALLEPYITLAVATQTSLVAIAETLITALRPWWFGFGGGYMLLGVIILVLLRLRQAKPAPPTPETPSLIDELPPVHNDPPKPL